MLQTRGNLSVRKTQQERLFNQEAIQYSLILRIKHHIKSMFNINPLKNLLQITNHQLSDFLC